MNAKRRHGRVRTPGMSTQLYAAGKVRPGLEVENLSLGGAFLRTNEVLAIGSRLGLVVSGPGLRQPLRLPGHVVSQVRLDESASRRLPPGMGIAFEPLPAEDQRQLGLLLQRLSPGAAVLEGDPTTPRPSAGRRRPTGPRGGVFFRTLEPGETLSEPSPEELPVVTGQVDPPVLHVSASTPAAETRLARELASTREELTACRTQLAEARVLVQRLTAENLSLKAELAQARRAAPGPRAPTR